MQTKPRSYLHIHMAFFMLAGLPAWPNGQVPAPCVSGLPADAKVMSLTPGIPRVSNIPDWTIDSVPEELEDLDCVVMKHTLSASPAPQWKLSVAEPAVIYLGVMDRGNPAVPEGWDKTDMEIRWSGGFSDTVYQRAVQGGEVIIPGHDGYVMGKPAGQDTERKFYGVPNFVIIKLEKPVKKIASAKNLMAGSPSGPWRRLFLDAAVVEEQSGVKRVFHAAEKYAGNPVLKADTDKPWEGKNYGTTVHGGTVMRDEGKLKLWYLGGRASHGWRICYAESQDGITWVKPALGIVEFNGNTDNNIVWDAKFINPEKTLFAYFTFVSVIKPPRATGPARRYAMYGYYHIVEVTPEGRFSKFHSLATRVAFSPDGLRWTLDEKQNELFKSGDVNQFYYDPYKKRFYATWKTGNRRGRAAGIVFSPDGLKWTKPAERDVFGADDFDPDASQIYGLGAFPYQGLYVGLPWIYHARWFKAGAYTDKHMYEAEADSPCTMDVQFAWSWDLLNWNRPPERVPFIALGKEGEFDAGMAVAAKDPVIVGDRLYFYYSGFLGRHNEGSKLQQSATGLATLRLDGFCSMRAGAEEGSLISRREQFLIPKVTVNAKTAEGGCVAAELLDAKNRVIPGFSRKECVPFTGDSVRHVLAWNTAELPEAELKTEKKIRFFLKNADLFSYFPDQKKTAPKETE